MTFSSFNSFHSSIVNTGPKQDIVFIGGAESPINSYFTNYIVNVPTGAGVDKYAGSYEVRSSSYFDNGAGAIAKPFTVFSGDNAFVNVVVGSKTSTYYIAWWGAGAGSVGYKPITNESLGYTRNPYTVDGVYQNGGAAANTFSTTYYINGASTSVAGEWIQINVPYNMRLISYNARSRFSDCRVPVKYVILGSNDGSTWYALDVVNIGTWNNYVALKKYTINNTTSYGNNYYSYFRYVIQEVDTSPNSTIATDKQYAHENQWNLVGIKEKNVNVGKTIYIGANSPSNFASYFTSRNVTIPSNFVSPEYVGTYTITESSTTGDTIGANLFRNDSTNNGQSYFVIWHSAYAGNAYINGTLVTYDRQPYNPSSNGDYRGTTSYYFGTSYYRTDNSVYYSGGYAYVGEWVQIKLPFRMKLTGYSHRTRYLDIATYGRNPDHNTIFGSNDGIIWYVVHTQVGVSTDLTPVVVNTTAFKDGIHGFSYFRWVIFSVNGGSADVVNENQLNLIGIRTT